MIQLRVLGTTDLRGPNGQALLSILSQPKRFTLLAYLALHATGGFVRRDKLLAVFWENSDLDKGRASLRSALSYLRRSLGEDVIVSRGDEEVGIASGSLECDAVLFEAALAAGDLEPALQRYGGTLLDGVHVAGAAALGEWLDLQRRRLMLLAVEAASNIADRRREQGDLYDALLWARKALALDPGSEPGIQRLIRLQSEVGDRAGAVRSYAAFEARLAKELEVEPSAETQALGASIRGSSGDRNEAAQVPRSVESTVVAGSTSPVIPHPSPSDSRATSSGRSATAFRWVAVT
ncbi:MAG: AfsR/SARP family transcriptional regulator, partial [Longimicrobiales bacterium]